MKVLIRTRGCRTQGWGHIVRMQGVYEYLSKHPKVDQVQVIAEVDSAAGVYLSNRIQFFEELPVNCSFAFEIERVKKLGYFDLCIFDMLEATEERQSFYAKFCRYRLLIDELKINPHVSEFVVCAQLTETELPASNAKVLEGLDYFILNQAFYRPGILEKRDFNNIKSTLVMLGGGVYSSAYLKLSGLLQKLDWPGDLFFVLGFDFPDCIQKEIQKLLPKAKFLSDLENYQIADLMTESDFALMSGGYSKYEAAALALPQAMIAVQDHQEEIGRAFAKTGAATYLGSFDNLELTDLINLKKSLLDEPKLLQEMSRKASFSIDGKGVQRVFEFVFSEMN